MFLSASGTGLVPIHTITFENLGPTITEVERAPSREISRSQVEGAHICISSELNHKQSTPIMIPLQIISSFTYVVLPEGKERA